MNYGRRKVRDLKYECGLKDAVDELAKTINIW